MELLEEVLKEGLLWAALGRPLEVMPFLRGKLLGNGYSEGAKKELEYLLDDLERFYKRVACCGRIEEKHMKAIKSFRKDIVSILAFEGRA
ncbi:hypothetical protein [Thermococcus sp.]